MTLFHYTCDHGRRGLGTRGMLRPNEAPLLGGRKLIWLTDQAVPDREGLGLTSYSLSCDRLAFRYRVETTDAEQYVQWAQRLGLPLLWRMQLEDVPGVQPATWYVLQTSALAILDRSYRKGAA